MKLKSSMGKMTKSTLVMVSSSMEVVPWYKELVFRYCKEAPQVAQWAPKILDYEARFQHMEVDDDGLALLTSVSKDLHLITECLRGGLLVSFVHCLVEKASMVADKCIQKQIPGDKLEQFTQQIQAVWGELAILYPHDNVVTETVESLGLHMQALQSESRAEKLSGVAQRFMNLEEKDEFQHDRLTCLDEMMEVSSTMPAKLKYVEGQQVLFAKVFDKVVEFVIPLLFEKMIDDPAPDLNKLVPMLSKMIDMFGFGSAAHKLLLESLQVASGLLSKVRSMVKKKEYDVQALCSVPEAKDKAMEWRRACLTMEGADKKMIKHKDMPKAFEVAWQMCMSYHAWCVTLVEGMVNELSRKASEIYENKRQALGLVAGGRKDGTSWTDQLGPKVTWKSISTRVVDGVLMDIAPNILPKSIDECIQVL